MPTQKIIIKAADYRYPNREELKQSYSNTPELHPFNFKSEHPIIALASKAKTISEVHRDDHLQYWGNILLNRNGTLSHTYHNAMVHYTRGFPDDQSAFEGADYINRIQFDYYSEIFYYHFSTVKDTIAQLLNVYYSMNLNVKKIFFKDVIGKVPDQRVSKVLKDFDLLTQITADYRNSFTHRMPINFPDSRSSVELHGKNMVYGSAKNNFIRSSVIKDNMKTTFNALADLLNELILLLPQ